MVFNGREALTSLNPSLGGIWSRSGGRYIPRHKSGGVLILLWVEYGLGEQYLNQRTPAPWS